MTDFKKSYTEKLKKYLYSTPTIDINGQTYLKVDMLKNSILDCEVNASNLNNETTKGIVNYSTNLGALLTIYNESDNSTIIEIDNYVRSPNHLRALPAFSRQEIDFSKLIHDLKQAQNDKNKLKEIARTLSRDDYIVKILKFNYNINAIISSCVYLGQDTTVQQDKIDARLLANTRAEEMIKTALSTNDMVFKYLTMSTEFILNGKGYDIDSYLNNVCSIINDNFKNAIKTQNPQDIHNALDILRLNVAKAYTECFSTLHHINKQMSELSNIKE